MKMEIIQRYINTTTDIDYAVKYYKSDKISR